MRTLWASNPIFLAILACFIWGSTYLPMKVGLESIPPFNFAGIRFTAASLLLILLLALRGQRCPQDTNLKALIILGIGQTGVVYACLHWGLQYVPSGIGAMLVNTNPFFVALFSFVFLGEKIGRQKIAGLLCGILGVYLIAYRSVGMESERLVQGEIALLGTSVGWAAATVLAKRLMASGNVPFLTAGQMLIGAICLLLLGWFKEGVYPPLSTPPLGAISLIYLIVIGTAFVFLIWYRALQLGQASTVAPFFFLIPATSALLGWAFLNEEINLRILLGLLSISIGIWIVNRAR